MSDLELGTQRDRVEIYADGRRYTITKESIDNMDRACIGMIVKYMSEDTRTMMMMLLGIFIIESKEWKELDKYKIKEPEND